MGMKYPFHKAIDPDVEILMDFKALKAMLREILKELDHVHLNDLPAFASRNPSSENLARHIFMELKARMAPGPARLYSVSVSENASSKAMYFEE